ncbi:MAG: hypothetical protein QF893_23390 [Alphaproteobacteria bacterium]|jgi:hypothetical protein|nr:hypothetical protein [Alphaproteobacteria bacterium]
MRRRGLCAAGNLLLVVAAVVFFELALQVASNWVSVVNDRTYPKRRSVIPDPVLGVRGDPDYPGHDARGFRNARALAQADIVALGDSHTYGGRIRRDEAWPALLATALGQSVYSMSHGSYGATHAAHNLDAALALRPKKVLFGLYFGNDFFDDFEFAQRHGRLADHASPEVLRQIERLEAESTIADEVGVVFRRGRKSDRAKADSETWFDVGVDWLKRTSRVYGLFRNIHRTITSRDVSFPDDAVLTLVFERSRDRLTPAQRAFVSPYEGPDWKTIFTARYRFKVLDVSDPRIRLGYEITKATLATMQQRLEREGIPFVVVFLPTKESVFGPRVAEPETHPRLAELVRTEARLRGELKAFMEQRNIRYIDPVPDLERASPQPYFSGIDGHPSGYGHRIIAAAVGRELARK